MKKKNFTQGIIYLIEVLFVSLFIISIYSYIEKDNFFAWFNNFFTLDFLSDFGLVFVVYQVFIYAFLSLYDSAINDGNLLIKSMIKKMILFSKNDESLEEIQEKINLFLFEKPNHYMFSEKQIKILNKLNLLIEQFQNKKIRLKKLIFYLEDLLIIIEHDTEYNSLSWQNSIILRICK